MFCLIFYVAFSSLQGPLLLSSSKLPISINHTSSLPTSDKVPSLPSDVLSLEQVKDIAATTQGFLSRDYSLYLGWNNVGIRGSLIQAKLMLSK